MSGAANDNLEKVYTLHEAADAVGFDINAFLSSPTPYTWETLRECSVYVMSCREFSKIGVARDTRKRMATLQVANPYELKLVHAEPLRSLTYAGLAERAAHRVLANRHLRSEWFSVSPELASKVISVTAGAARVLASIHDEMNKEAA